MPLGSEGPPGATPVFRLRILFPCENALALFHTQSLVHGGVLQFTMCSMKMGSCQNHVLTHVNCLSKVCTKGRDVKFHHPA